ncbi:hypothetical protein HAX54_005925, partial [Datura stramonium]|nr:hypothetical protein [Datura stramonium]
EKEDDRAVILVVGGENKDERSGCCPVGFRRWVRWCFGVRTVREKIVVYGLV